MGTELGENARWRRVIVLLVAFALIELGLAFVVHLTPAVRVLMQPVYVVVAIAFLVSLHAATRQRHGDRRQSDRRHEAEP
ncbi:MAG TPA: hypothetical protein VFJ20_15085 [Gemmatimonadaceae bacterium]|nr:hypothetical protein [Gemmatimonadaceae bacterium]